MKGSFNYPKKRAQSQNCQVDFTVLNWRHRFLTERSFLDSHRGDVFPLQRNHLLGRFAGNNFRTRLSILGLFQKRVAFRGGGKRCGKLPGVFFESVLFKHAGVCTFFWGEGVMYLAQKTHAWNMEKGKNIYKSLICCIVSIFIRYTTAQFYIYASIQYMFIT